MPINLTIQTKELLRLLKAIGLLHNYPSYSKFKAGKCSGESLVARRPIKSIENLNVYFGELPTLNSYLLLPSVPPGKPPILPNSMKGTAPPET
jgi:hypothetical protein